MRLQKLVYYCQAWSLVWDEEPIFYEKIEAWSGGPVVKELYDKHRGMFKVDWSTFMLGDSSKLNKEQKDTVDNVLEYYGNKTAQWLSDLTHMEEPWKKARDRDGLNVGVRGNAEILLSDMHEYYSGLIPKE